MHGLIFSPGGKSDIYREILPQIQALVEDEPNLVANLANMASALKSAFDWLWVGFYLVEGNELVLGPFQGPPACTRIAYGRGVCGQSWARRQVMVVPDVNRHPDHIACSSLSQSEIAVPVYDRSGGVVAVLDADSETTGQFDRTDAQYLQELCALIGRLHFSGVR